MAKVGYIMAISQYDKLEEDRKWMNEFGCVRIIEESDDNERHRPLWKQLMAALQRGDELVIPKFSNALRGSRELATFLEFCRVKVFFCAFNVFFKLFFKTIYRRKLCFRS